MEHQIGTYIWVVVSIIGQAISGYLVHQAWKERKAMIQMKTDGVELYITSSSLRAELIRFFLFVAMNWIWLDAIFHGGRVVIYLLLGLVILIFLNSLWDAYDRPRILSMYARDMEERK